MCLWIRRRGRVGYQKDNTWLTLVKEIRERERSGDGRGKVLLVQFGSRRIFVRKMLSLAVQTNRIQANIHHQSPSGWSSCSTIPWKSPFFFLLTSPCHSLYRNCLSDCPMVCSFIPCSEWLNVPLFFERREKRRGRGWKKKSRKQKRLFLEISCPPLSPSVHEEDWFWNYRR